MVRLLVLAATGPEMKVVKTQISQLRIPRLDVKYFTTGVGIHATIFSVTKMLSTTPAEDQFDMILNIWVCGYTEEKPAFIQVWAVINVHTHKESIIPIPCLVWPIARIGSSDVPVLTKDTSDYYDMESFAIDYVAQQFQIPRILVKVPVDRIWAETINFDFKKALEALSENIDYRDMIEKIMNYFGKL